MSGMLDNYERCIEERDRFREALTWVCEAAIAFESDLSTDCDCQERDNLRKAVGDALQTISTEVKG